MFYQLSRTLSCSTIDSSSENVLKKVNVTFSVHTHHFVPVKSGVHTDKNSQEKQAIEHAELAHASLSKSFGILHADSANLKPGVQYRVDTKKLVLTEVR